MAQNDAELLSDFIAESREHLADIEAQLLEIEAGGASIDPDLVNTVFRAVHSIKGAAGFLGLTVVNSLAHALENVLGRIRNRELVPTPEVIDVALRAADALTKLINDVESTSATDVSEHLEALNSIAPSHPSRGIAGDRVADDGEIARPCDTPHNDTPLAMLSLETFSVPPCDNSIRVQVSVLDKLMNLAGELVLGRNQLLQTLSSSASDSIERAANRLDRVTSQLQETIMRTRMQPIGTVFSRFPRLARDLAAKLGKQCTVVIDGKEVEVDKTVLEAVSNPLMHLLRNSIDHGIETPAARVAAGKNPHGTVALRAYHQAGKVRIDVVDNGAGIDPAKLRQKAVQKGILSEDQSSRMSDREAVRLVLHPGFSTAESVTEISGRGVGMDVVRANIEKLGGTVNVASVAGTGTTIQITLPLTLAIIPSLIIRASGECFAIPQANVLELVRVRAAELDQYVGRVKDTEVLRLRGALLPLVRLDQLLQLSPAGMPSTHGRTINVIVIESGQHHYGLVVDAIVDSEEIVVKPLGRHVKTSPCLAGATIRGDGRIALILDAGGIAAQAELKETEERILNSRQNSPGGQTQEDDAQDVLLFSTTADERFAMPMRSVSRIARVHVRAIKVVGNRRVLEYRGRSLPLLQLDELIATPAMPTSERYFVVVFGAAGRETGLLVSRLDDIRRLAPNIDAQLFRQKGVAGGFVFQGVTLRMLDVDELADMAFVDGVPANDIVSESAEHRATTPLTTTNDILDYACLIDS